ncbi:MAG: SRPBCC family protein [Nitrosotalea sp.]
MIEIDVSLQIDAPQENVWNIISKIDNDPKYWCGISSIRNISKNQDVITRELTLVNGSKCFQKVTLFQREGIHIRWTHGPIVGIKDILLTSNGNVTIVAVQINYRLSGVVRLVPKSILEELQFEAEQALALIKQEVEKNHSTYKGIENYELT